MLAEAVALVTCIQEVTVQILAGGTLAGLIEVFCGFPWSLHTNARIVTQIRPQLLPS